MNQEASPDRVQLVLADDEGIGRIVVDMEAFFELCFDFAENLEALVARWSAYAAPQAQGRSLKRSGL